MKIKQGEEYTYYNFKFEQKDVKNIFSSNKIFLSKKDGKYGYVDKKGNTVIDYIYDDATEQNEYGYAAVKKDGKWGSINKNGEEVAKPQYDLENNLKIVYEPQLEILHNHSVVTKQINNTIRT